MAYGCPFLPLFKYDVSFGLDVPEDATYEQLLQLDEANVPRGASPTQIDLLPVHAYHRPLPIEAAHSSQEECVICKDSFDEGTIIRTLPCTHRFCQECIDPWLRQSKRCPICNFDAFEDVSFQ